MRNAGQASDIEFFGANPERRYRIRTITDAEFEAMCASYPIDMMPLAPDRRWAILVQRPAPGVFLRLPATYPRAGWPEAVGESRARQIWKGVAPIWDEWMRDAPQLMEGLTA